MKTNNKKRSVVGVEFWKNKNLKQLGGLRTQQPVEEIGKNGFTCAGPSKMVIL
jgi:hypothetical protein